MRALFPSCVAAVLVLCAPALPALADPVAVLLQGTQNSRDIGGVRTTDGHVVKRGVVYRSDSLGTLSATGLADMARLGVRQDDDLRTDKERGDVPDRLPEGVQHNVRQVFSQADFARFRSGQDQFYRSFVSFQDARDAVAQVLRDIEHGPEALLYHCSAGQDRTGWVTAVLLTLLGVPREAVNTDYLLSNVYHQAAGSSMRVGLGDLDSAFAEADRAYGSFGGFVHDGLGIGDDDIAALKAKLLE
ncbi:MAG: tyrosine-protein phosphatase [Segniliparus sp.]|uniref:tyrosine-protein phosphatase n=1 Tax=Segniliparus sp. TaxID=2804064 RepID=UPI003F41A99F